GNLQLELSWTRATEFGSSLERPSSQLPPGFGILDGNVSWEPPIGGYLDRVRFCGLFHHSNERP
ncbi:hypothetical protein LINGRAHAP2_LOCUS31943, partial [Linum grandiflorum]